VSQHDLSLIEPSLTAHRLCNVLRVAGQSVPEELLKFGGTVKKKAHPQYGAFYRESDPSMTPAKIVFDD
jgi:ATP-dependent RNA helicase DBP3